MSAPVDRTELLEDWNLAQAGASLKKIDPLPDSEIIEHGEELTV